ncbi:NAD(P)/FAD-dependent oxidoreductase [Caldivirga maquilingensis]|uniref:NAD(P)/FAD-dependent oxidoreductase n=1 Tax=Caldivirga maquilingensis TaxID=76887 RepID=UPI00064E4B7A|nr:NAD(P)/FAD-dependent oxidoreductase [Caldivirga maquilingensis]
MKIGLIGAGPSNLFLAWLLRNEADFHLIEEDKRLGLPLHCTGLVSERMAIALGISRRVFDNYYDKLTVTTNPYSSGVLLRFTNSRVTMLNRPGLEEYLYGEASLKMEHMGVRAIDVNHKGVVKGSGGFEDSFDLVVIGEGARNVLSRRVLGNRLVTVSGIQVDGYSPYLRNMVNDDHHIIVLFNEGYSSRFFTWIVPKGNGEFRIGVVDDTNVVGLRFRRIINQFRVTPRRVFGGRIVLGSLNVNYGYKSVVAVGDSTGVTKALTGGGIITGMLTSLILARVIHESDTNVPERYSSMLNGTLGRLAKVYSILSSILYNNIKLIEMALREVNGSHVEVKVPDYDNHMDALIRLLMTNPKIGLKVIKYAPLINMGGFTLRDVISALL